MIYCRSADSPAGFVAKGFPLREFFAHRAVVVRKQYPDTLLLLERRGLSAAEILAGRCLQINLYAEDLEDFPAELFTDHSLNWHNQQLGQRGLMAAAGLFSKDDSVFVTVMQSDLCQQLFRHPPFRLFKTRIESRFGHWYRLLLNAILDLAAAWGIAAVYVPTAGCILALTRKRIFPELFERIYDDPACRYASRRVAHDRAEYWQIRLSENLDRIVPLSPCAPERPNRRLPVISIVHDIEENVDTHISPRQCQDNLRTMLAMEKAHDLRTTYTVLGRLFTSKRGQIWGSDPRHALGFHSFDHSLTDESQLARCREVDLQVRGYRPPRSRLTGELTDYRLAFLNFDWLASGAYSLGSSCCELRNGIARIPILTDDHPVFSGKMGYAQWEEKLLASARNSGFVAFGLHDCYGAVWLPHYLKLLDELAKIGSFATVEEISDELYWEQGLDFPAPTETVAVP